ncbi:hypothetical protein ACEWX3_07680 [Mycobacterium sp. G7A2]
MSTLLESLVAERRRCGGDKCNVRRCKRCRRYREWLAKGGRAEA